MDQIEHAVGASGSSIDQWWPIAHPIETCVHRLFEMQSARTPNAIALNFANACLTYQELNARANQLAHHLQTLGVGPEVLVGLCLERSLEMIVAILGILKAGGAFVPLDPAYPKERLAFMLHDAQVALLITQHSLAEQFTDHAISTLSLDSNQDIIAQHKTHNLASTTHPENLAYVIYTSGSTGQPKGVMVRHRGLCNLALAQRHAFEIQAESRILQFASLSFDASVWEIFMALLSGATLHLAAKASLLPGPSLVDVLQQQAITVATLPPSALAILPDVALPLLQTLITAGEACPASLVARWAPERRFFNAYGPTETTVCATMARCNDGKSNPPIGLPIANMQTYVLDEDLQLAQVGVSGEIYIGGTGLARGYLGRSELTAERFIPHPFGQEPGTRLYKTGDLARYLADGQIEFLGRSDSQVKIRGFRIELGEIEALLNAHPAVREAAVIVREDEPGERRLVAYLIAHQGQDTIFGALRTDLQAALPDYMLPSAFVVLTEWPLTPNGKIDRRSLPVPASDSLAFLEPFIAPRTSCEEALAHIWCEMLHLDRVGIHDSFFILGGHSLLATQIAARVRSTFQVEMPLPVLFTHSTIAELASYIEHGAKQQLQVAIQRLPRVGNLPLSFSQERVWFLQQLDPTNMAYNAQAMLRLTGRLDVAALESSLNKIVQRHEIFRTTFPAVNGHPIQLIHQAQAIKLPLIDLQMKAGHEQELAMRQRMDEEFQKPFDVTQLPLVRWTLLRLSEQEYILVHVEHHLLHDGWSFTVFLRELQELYTTFVTGRSSSLPDLVIQFADFAQWQRQWMRGEEAEAQLHYWKQKLAGSPALLALPTDHPRPAILGFKGEVLRIDLPVSLCEALRMRCRQDGVTLYMLLLGAFLTLLYRYTGQEDLCIGTGIANRRWQETEPLIGMIINTLALRTDLSGKPTFRELLRRVREVTLEAYAHQDLPFGKIVEALQPERSLSRSPLYQAAFSFHDSPLPDLNLPDLEVKVTEGLSNHSAKFDINIVVIPRAEQLVGMQAETEEKVITLLWEYNTDLFDTPTMNRMVGHYVTLLASIVNNPGQRISEVPILTEAEREQILVVWNSTHVVYPQTRCVQQLFETQVEEHPHALALRFAEKQLNYIEINQRANQLAHYLQRQGVGPEVPVAIYIERSLDLIIGILGILKAGGAYVPLDPAYPKERISFILKDAHIPVLLTWHQLVAGLPEYEGEVLCLDSAKPLLAQQSQENLQSRVQSDALAYIIYTSGSTGQPKGIQINHSGLLNLVHWHRQTYQVTAADRATQLAGIGFDAAVWEIWPYLTAGASLHIPDEETRLSPARLRDWLVAHDITFCFLPTPLAENILAEEWPEHVPLRVLLTGGDRLHIYPSSSLPFTVVNHYGPSETTVVASAGVVLPTMQVGNLPSIGRPISNTQIYLLDSQLRPVPVGVTGELCIGGESLARGYLNRPDLTAAQFIPHPFSTQPGARLYRTGDLARFLPNGNIEFLGRSDFQVKLRGLRIELEEIEYTLKQHPSVQDCIVVLREDVPSDRRLVAYITLRSEEVPIVNAVRSFLQERLPEYMIPAHFLLLDHLPLTPNGKVDRQTLPLPDWDRSLQTAAFAPPRNAVEEEIVAIWSVVIGLPKVGIHDNFFTLGGHSLLATQIVSRLCASFQMELPLRSFFEAPTVAGLAATIVARQADEADSALLTQLLAELDQTI